MSFIGNSVVYLFLTGKKYFHTFSCHDLGSFIGTLSDVNHNGQNGVFYGNPIQLGYQINNYCLFNCMYNSNFTLDAFHNTTK
jgi:hypothetical protein